MLRTEQDRTGSVIEYDSKEVETMTVQTRMEKRACLT